MRAPTAIDANLFTKTAPIYIQPIKDIRVDSKLLISHLQLNKHSLKISNINLGRASQERQEVFTPLGKGQQCLIKLLQVLQLQLQPLYPKSEGGKSMD